MHTDIQPWQEDPPRILQKCSLNVAAFLNYWLAKRSGSELVRRSDIDPIELKPWMGRLTITEVLAGGADFRYRLAGTGIVAASGADFTGRNLASHSYKSDGHAVVHDLRTFVLSARPRYRIDRALMSTGKAFMSERIALPLTTDGTSVDQIITLIQSIELVPDNDDEIRGLFTFMG